MSSEEFSITTRGSLAWHHGYGDLAPESHLSFAGSNGFTIKGASLAKNAVAVEAGLDLNLSRNAVLGLSYQGEWSSDRRDNAVKANFSVKF